MTAQCVRSSEPPPASPLTARLEISLADELLLAGMKALVAFPVVLPSESLATHVANEWPLVRVGTQVRTQVVRSREALGT